MTYLQIQSMFEPSFPPGRLVCIKSNFFLTLSAEAIDAALAAHGPGRDRFIAHSSKKSMKLCNFAVIIVD